MNKLVRNAFAILIGLVIGGMVNMGIVMTGPSLIPPPEGVDVSSAESIAAAMHLFEPRHFITPFVAHAVGTLIGAALAFLIAASYRQVFAYVIGAAFFAGGVMMSVSIPAPAWFIGADLLLAYFPMAFAGQKLAARLSI